MAKLFALALVAAALIVAAPAVIEGKKKGSKKADTTITNKVNPLQGSVMDV
jgi:hypothetical protein